jgi:hypothetical protein
MVEQHGMSLMPLGAGAEWPSKRLSWLFALCFQFFFEKVGGMVGYNNAVFFLWYTKHNKKIPHQTPNTSNSIKEAND